MNKTQRLAAFSAGQAEALGLTPERLAALHVAATARNLATLEGTSDVELELVVAHAAATGNGPLLEALLAGPKRLAKAVKRAQQEAKSAGRTLEVAAPVVAAKSAPSTEAGERPRTFLGRWDSDRQGFFVFEPATRSVTFGSVDEVAGLVDLDIRPDRSPSGMRRDIADMTEPRQPALFEVEATRFGGWLARAAALHDARNKLVPDAFEALREQFPGQVADDVSPASLWAEKPLDEERQLRHEARALLGEQPFIQWMPDPEAIERLHGRLDEVGRSVLVVDEAQRRNQMEAALDLAVDGWFDATRRALWARRLFDMATLYASVRRALDADRCAATARGALDASIPASQLPLLRTVFTMAIVRASRQQLGAT